MRAASVTCAPAAASAEAAASPTPRPPPVTSARLPSRRKEGVLARSIEVTTRSASASALPPPLKGRVGERWSKQQSALPPSGACDADLPIKGGGEIDQARCHLLRRLG